MLSPREMLSFEKLLSTSIKNRAEVTQLQTELTRIEKEKQNELRMLNNEKQRFKARYSKSSFTPEYLTYEASAVKMYETHNPGFCFRRNGEHRVQQAPTVNAPVDFQHLHFLLFTDGEVDIEKVLCLHLLSTHETEHLAPPKRGKLTPLNNVFLKRDTPLEQLIERSKSKQNDLTTSTISLPTYVLDVNKENTAPLSKLKEDSRLTCRLLLNEKILELIMTVISTLEDSNPDKVLDLMSIAEDPVSLKKIFRKPHIQEFVLTLKNQTLVSSSFILTQPNKIKANHIEIRTQSGALEDLVKFIRENVLQLPHRETWRRIQERAAQFDNEPSPQPQNISLSGIKRSAELSKTNQVSPDSVKTEPKRSPSKSLVNDVATKFRRSSVNFVSKNIAEVGNYKRNTDSDMPSQPTRIRSDSLNNKTKGYESGKSKSRRSSTAEKTQTRRESSDASQVDGRKSSTKSEEEVKYHLKQTTCPACMEKWREPLPSPKVATKLTKNNRQSDKLDEEELAKVQLKTNSIQRLTALIAQEQFKVSSYDRRYSNSSNSSNVKIGKKQNNQNREALDFVQLDAFDLEKIRQEIREKEAEKKLEKFLGD